MENYFDRFDADGAPARAPVVVGPDPVDYSLPKPEPIRSNYFDKYDPPKPRAVVEPVPAAAPPGQDANFFDRFDDGATPPDARRVVDISHGQSISAPAKKSLWDRAVEGFTDTVEHYSPAAWIARQAAGVVPSTEDYGNRALPADQQQDLRQQRITQGERDWREQSNAQHAQDPNWIPGDSLMNNLVRTGAGFAGNIAGGAISDPTSAIAPGRTIVGKMLGQAAVSGGADLGQQGLEINEGVRDHVDPFEVAVSTAAGGALPGVVEGAKALRNHWRGRGVNVDNIPDEELLSGSLDGSLDPQGRPMSEGELLQIAGPEPQKLLADQRPPEERTDVAVIDEAIRSGEQDPVIGEIATSDMDPATRAQLISDRVAARRNEPIDIGKDPVDYSLPQEDTPEVPQSPSNRPGSPSDGEDRPAGDLTDFVINDLEGGGKRVVDSGGVTRFGISKDANPDVDVENLTEAQARQIYRDRYETPLALADDVDPAFRAVAFDTAVNHGVGRAKRMVAEADGDAGKLLQLRRDEYARLVASNPEKYGKYANGWENRLQKLEGHVGTGGSAKASEPAEAVRDPEGRPIEPDPVDEFRPIENRQQEPVGESLSASDAPRLSDTEIAPDASVRPPAPEIDPVVMAAELAPLRNDGAERMMAEAAAPARAEPQAQLTLFAKQDGPTIRSAEHQRLSEALDRGEFGNVDFGRLSNEKLDRINEIRSRLGQDVLQDRRLVIPSNVVRKLYDQRVLRDGMAPGEVADMLVSVFHANKSQPTTSNRYPHIQALVNAREQLSNIGFIAANPKTGETVVKSAYPVATDRLPNFVGKEPGGPRDIPSSVDQPKPVDPQSTISDVQAPERDVGSDEPAINTEPPSPPETPQAPDTPDAGPTTEGGTLFRRAREAHNADVISEPQRLATGVERIAATHESPHYRALAARLAPLVGEAEAKYGPVSTEGLKPGETAKGRTDLYEDGHVEASVHDPNDAETALHEAIHVATLTRYGEMKDRLKTGTGADPVLRDLESLRARATKAARGHDDPVIREALSSNDEFLAYGLTHPGFQSFLKSKSTANLWGRFVDGVRNILGLEGRHTNLLDKVLQSGSKLMGEMEKAPKREAPSTSLFSKEGDPTASPEGWRKIADLAVDTEWIGKGGAGLVQGIKDVFGEPRAALRTVGENLQRFGTATMYSADSALRTISARFEAPTIAKLADMFHAPAGKADSVGRTYHEAIERGTRTRLQKAYDALKPHLDNKPSMDRIRDLLARPTVDMRASAAEREAAGKVRDLLKETLEYRRAAGEEIGEVTDGYFPRVLDPIAVIGKEKEFKAAAAKLYEGVGAKDPEASANAWFARITDSYTGLDGGLDHIKASGKPDSGKAREFGKDADTLLKGFYQDDPFLTLAGYLTGAARRAEEVRRFGPKGAAGSPEREAWTAEHGDKSQWDVMLDDIRDELRASTKDPSGVMDEISGIRAVNLGRINPLSNGTRSFISGLHTWNQLAKMDRVTVSSLGDLAMGFVRGGPRLGVQHFSDSLVEFARAVTKRPPSEAKRLAEAVGVANEAFSSDLLRARADMDPAKAGAHLLLDKFYRGVGLQQLTEGGRIAATKTGASFLHNLAHDLTSETARTRQRAGFYLRELGVQDVDGFGTWLRKGAPSADDLLADKGTAAEYATALMRYVNQSILMPTRAEKPKWASHPLGSLFFSLQSFSYGFKKNVLDRVGRTALEGIKTKDPTMLAPAFGLLVFAGITALNDTFLRPAIFGSNYDFENETPGQFLMRTADRGGMTGGLSPLINAFMSTKYQRSVVGSLAGPIIGSLGDTATDVAKLWTANSKNTHTAEHNAAAAVYDTLIEPAADALASAALKGPLKTAAIFATGNRSDKGLLPSDREAFADEVGGEKPK